SHAQWTVHPGIRCLTCRYGKVIRTKLPGRQCARRRRRSSRGTSRWRRWGRRTTCRGGHSITGGIRLPTTYWSAGPSADRCRTTPRGGAALFARSRCHSHPRTSTSYCRGGCRVTEQFVIATAGHVDHGKSALVRALTGTTTDRWETERQRGLTIDLGFAHLLLPSGRSVSFFDFAGHVRFVGNMLAGLGPTPIVCLVVAADAGWQAQTTEHRDAIKALGIDTGIIVISRIDLAPDTVDIVSAEIREQLAGTGLADAPIVAA